MTSKGFSLIALLMLMFITAASSSAQENSSAEKVFQVWKEKSLTAGAKSEGKYIAMGFAAKKSNEQSAAIDIVVGTGKNVSNLGEMSFVIQPLIVKQGSEGKKVFENIGNAGRVRFPELLKRPGSDIIADPHVVVPVSDKAGAIRITVSGLSGNFSAILPLGQEISTAVLAGTVDRE